MKNILLVFILLCSACTQTSSEVADEEVTNPEVLTADFTPPVGAGDQKGIEGPWARRLMGAYSADGVTWTKTNSVISDQADVSDLVVDESGRLYLYYYGWTVGDQENVPAMAISDDNGETWIFKNMNFDGFPNRGSVSDPTVVYDNGIFQLYGSTRDNGQTYLLHGESANGIDFTYNGIAFKPATGNAGVATVYKTGDEWHLFSLASLGFNDGTEVGTVWHAISKDGESFELKETLLFSDEQNTYFHGNVVPFKDGYRLYVFSGKTGGIRSFFSEDGNVWELESGFRLTLEEESGLESDFLSDPDVVQLSDGTYFMTYSTLIPE